MPFEMIDYWQELQEVMLGVKQMQHIGIAYLLGSTSWAVLSLWYRKSAS